MSASSPVDSPVPSLPSKTAALFRKGHRLDPRDNSLNLLRLVFALMVLVAHSFYIAGVGKGPELHGENLGGFAVYGFFTISGYLITGSRFGNRFGTYLIHRLARILPAFWVCLLVLVLFFAPIGYWRLHGSIDGYLTTPRTPGEFLLTHWTLKMFFYDIAGTPAGVPYPGAWNGSLWTLYFEFLCYLIVGALGFFAIVRRSTLVVAALFVASVVAQGLSPQIVSYFGGSSDALFLLKLLPFFLGGSLLYMLRKTIPLHWPLALGAAVVAAVLVVFVTGWGMQAAAPFATYVILWIASVVPAPQLAQRHDVSYGVYIYAFPTQQLMAIFDVQAHGFLLFNLAAVAGTFPLAIASWLLVERPVMRAARRATGLSASSPISLDESRPVPGALQSAQSNAAALPSPDAAVPAPTGSAAS